MEMRLKICKNFVDQVNFSGQILSFIAFPYACVQLALGLLAAEGTTHFGKGSRMNV